MSQAWFQGASWVDETGVGGRRSAALLGRVKGLHKETSQEVYVCCLFSEATEYFQITGKYNGIFISLST